MTRDVIRHPGPPAPKPYVVARGRVRKLPVTLQGGRSLMDAVADVMEKTGSDSGVIVVDGMDIGPYDYVMPGPSDDGVHAAWYSATHHGSQARIRHGSAIVGKRDGAWWLHCHAVWEEGDSVKCGHLLPDDVTLPNDAGVVLYAFNGGAFDVSLNEETLFPIFHPVDGASDGNALIAKVNPHHDIHQTVSQIVRDAGFARAEVLGVGSLIGARFEAGAPMESPISEVVITPVAQWAEGELRLPMYCVDPDDGQFSGDIVAGGAPVCVTFELMVIEAA
ncbi:hypothetical protein [Roseovarius pacificus]|uniref:hypothetical protein n=1 Tax=Roseovarius pacificus TaxID=337701 RepID=UPI0040394119